MESQPAAESIPVSPETAAHRKRRIWELDALRGGATIVMIFDLVVSFLYRLFAVIWSDDAALVRAVNTLETFRMSEIGSALRMIFCALIFIVIAGINAVYSRRNVKRGVFLLALGVIMSLGGYLVKFFTGYDFAIRFGILQFLGVCILLGQLLRPLKNSWLLAIATLTVIVGYLNGYVEFEDTYLLPIFNYSTGNPTVMETYPIVPYVGYFIFGMVMGKAFYAPRVTLLPGINPHKIRWLTWTGERSFSFYFWITAVTQPVLWMTCAFFA